jgi:putative membrane protein
MLETAAVLPHINAALNATSTVLLLIGFTLIRTGRRAHHRKVMIAALIVSAVFLVLYLLYHFTAPIFVFKGPDWSRPLYYTLLVSHVALAAIVTPLVGVTAWRALHGNFDRHKALARITLPVWLYVTVTGVVIYVILYHVYPTPSV